MDGSMGRRLDLLKHVDVRSRWADGSTGRMYRPTDSDWRIDVQVDPCMYIRMLRSTNRRVDGFICMCRSIRHIDIQVTLDGQNRSRNRNWFTAIERLRSTDKTHPSIDCHRRLTIVS